MTDAEEKLREAWAARRRHLLSTRTKYMGLVPPEEEKELLDAFADLELYRGYIAGIISTLIAHREVSRYPLKYNPELRGRLEAIVRKGAPESVSAARQYIEALDEIERFVVMGEKVLDPNPH